jgi:hypothetical protein
MMWASASWTTRPWEYGIVTFLSQLDLCALEYSRVDAFAVPSPIGPAVAHLRI